MPHSLGAGDVKHFLKSYTNSLNQHNRSSKGRTAVRPYIVISVVRLLEIGITGGEIAYILTT
jgi:hypothetical protein